MTFKEANLITPESLRDDLLGSFIIRPDWAKEFFLVDPEEDDIALNQVLLFPPSDKKPSDSPHPKSHLTPTQAAILFETTRYGHRIEINSNGAGGDYMKISFDGFKPDGSKAREDNIVIARVFEGAGGANRVLRNRRNPEDQTEGLKTTGAVTDGSDRAKVLLNAARASREADRTEEQTYQYIGNLMRLLELHDTSRRDEGASA